LLNRSAFQGGEAVFLKRLNNRCDTLAKQLEDNGYALLVPTLIIHKHFHPKGIIGIFEVVLDGVSEMRSELGQSSSIAIGPVSWGFYC